MFSPKPAQFASISSICIIIPLFPQTRPAKNGAHRNPPWGKAMSGFTESNKFVTKGDALLCLALTIPIPTSPWFPAPVRPWTSSRWRPPRTCVYPHHLKVFAENIIKIYLNRRIDPQKGIHRAFEAWCIPVLRYHISGKSYGTIGHLLFWGILWPKGSHGESRLLKSLKNTEFYKSRIFDYSS